MKQVMLCVYCGMNAAIFIEKNGYTTVCDDDECLADYALEQLREGTAADFQALIDMGYGEELE